MKQRPEFFSNFGWPDYLFYLQKLPDPHLQGKKFNFFQNQNDTCAHLFRLVMKFHDRQSSERCIRKLISRHCLDKSRTRWNDFLFLITDDRDFRPQTCTNGLRFLGNVNISRIFLKMFISPKTRFILL
jgi:hypothetical protein